MRRKAESLPGVTGVARLDRRTSRLVGRLNPGDIAIIDHTDLDRVSAEALLAAQVAAVVNVQPSISGRYPNLGPELLIAHGVPLLDNVGDEVFAVVKEGTKLRLDGDTLYLDEDAIVSGVAQDEKSIAAAMDDAKAGLATQLESFAATTSDYMKHEQALLLDGVGIPEVRTKFADRHALVVVRGYDHKQELAKLKHYLREYRPVLIGVDGGADVLLDAGYRPDVIIGDMDAVSDEALTCGAEIVVHAYPDGRTPGLTRALDVGIEPVQFTALGTSEDIALLLADEKGAELIVLVGAHATLTEFLDRGRGGMASTFLTRLRLGSKLLDASGVARLYRARISTWALLLLVLAAILAIVAALAVSEAGRGYFTDAGGSWRDAVDWAKGLFT